MLGNIDLFVCLIEADRPVKGDMYQVDPRLPQPVPGVTCEWTDVCVQRGAAVWDNVSPLPAL